MKQGQMVKITDVIDADTAQLVAEELGHTVRRVAESDVEEGLFDAPDDRDHARAAPAGRHHHGPRRPRQDVAARRHPQDQRGRRRGRRHHPAHRRLSGDDAAGAKITFIDTPGHAAFTAMRARGAKVTDIVVLVVAADDGVMPQTVEAINHAKAAKVPIIVAINKIDKPDAKPERVRTELLQHEIQVESLGGDVLDVEVSATKKTNLDKLLETHPAAGGNARPQGQSGPPRRRHRDRGEARPRPRPGRDRAGAARHAACRRHHRRRRRNGAACARWSTIPAQPISEAGPSMPVEVLGFNGTPEAGDRLAVVENEGRAREITDYRERQKRDKLAARGGGRAARSSR